MLMHLDNEVACKSAAGLQPLHLGQPKGPLLTLSPSLRTTHHTSYYSSSVSGLTEQFSRFGHNRVGLAQSLHVNVKTNKIVMISQTQINKQRNIDQQVRSKQDGHFLKRSLPQTVCVNLSNAGRMLSKQIAQCVQWVPPWQYTTYGSLRGPSALSSAVLPSTKVPSAKMTSSP